MQLLVEFENTPEDAPQVLCSVSGALNREEIFSVPRTVLAANISEEDQLFGKRGQDILVPVINMQKKAIPDSVRNSEQVEIFDGNDWIKNYYYNFKMVVGQFLHPSGLFKKKKDAICFIKCVARRGQYSFWTMGLKKIKHKMYQVISIQMCITCFKFSSICIQMCITYFKFSSILIVKRAAVE